MNRLRDGCTSKGVGCHTASRRGLCASAPPTFGTQHAARCCVAPATILRCTLRDRCSPLRLGTGGRVASRPGDDRPPHPLPSRGTRLGPGTADRYNHRGVTDELSQHGQIILFGGSFDPPHVGHVALPEQVRQAVGADVVAYMPAARSPHKLDQAPTPAVHRLAMLRLALAGQPHALILTDELDRAADGRPSYTVETLEGLSRRVGEATRLRLLIGADQVARFDAWRDAARIIELAEPLVMLRPPETATSLLDAMEPDERDAWRGRLVEVAAMDVSSSEVRRRVAAGASIAGLVPEGVARYIDEHGLYRG